MKGATQDGFCARLVQAINPAPVKGATQWSESDNGKAFQPRTREGCDSTQSRHFSLLQNIFNPRTREGCDSHKVRKAGWQKLIHAPVKGATHK